MKKPWRVRLAHWLLRWEAANITWDLQHHLETCIDRRCRHVDLDNCDESSFCKIGSNLFIRAFDLLEVSA